jgi:hypothetical protein
VKNCELVTKESGPQLRRQRALDAFNARDRCAVLAQRDIGSAGLTRGVCANVVRLVREPGQIAVEGDRQHGMRQGDCFARIT